MIGLLILLFFVWMFSMWAWVRQLEGRIDALAEALRLSVDLYKSMGATQRGHQQAIEGILDILGKMAR